MRNGKVTRGKDESGVVYVDGSLSPTLILLFFVTRVASFPRSIVTLGNPRWSLSSQVLLRFLVVVFIC